MKILHISFYRPAGETRVAESLTRKAPCKRVSSGGFILFAILNILLRLSELPPKFYCIRGNIIYLDGRVLEGNENGAA